MNSEITDQRAANAPCLLFDADCAFCSGLARRFTPFLHRLGITLAPLQSPWVPEVLGRDPRAPLEEMRLLFPDGRAPGGVGAILEIARRTFWGWPLLLVAAIPGVKPLLRRAYREFAARRHCLNGACSIKLRKQWLNWIPLFALLFCVLLAKNHLAAWVFMWALGAAIFAGCKWGTLKTAIQNPKAKVQCPVPKPSAGSLNGEFAPGCPPVSLSPGERPGVRGRSALRAVGYLLAWPGMDAQSFFSPAKRKVRRASTREWVWAFAKTISGALMVGIAVNLHAAQAPLLRGWAAMIGIVVFLHFGVFELLWLAWRGGGTAAPVMNKPLQATSLSDFWGNRWNTAFSELAHQVVFLPVVRRHGIRAATLGVFLVSGLIHDLVISVPAGSGYGLPTLYFLLQGCGVLAERSARRHHLARGGPGKLFTFMVVVGPVFCLFHPPFVRNVILPMLEAIKFN